MTWLDAFPSLSGDRALDVATGSGALARELAGRYAEVVGIDRPAVIAKAAPVPGVRFTAMDAESLAFPDAHFDLVAIAWGLHHLANPTRVLLEMRRVLKPGGTFLIAEPIDLLQGSNQDLHVQAHQLLARMDRAAGRDHFPLYARLQVGSVIQGLGLGELGFHPFLQDPGEAGWELAQCREAAARFIERLEAAAADPTVDALDRLDAHALAAHLQRDGMRTGPLMIVTGRAPAQVAAGAGA